MRAAVSRDRLGNPSVWRPKCVASRFMGLCYRCCVVVVVSTRVSSKCGGGVVVYASSKWGGSGGATGVAALRHQLGYLFHKAVEPLNRHLRRITISLGTVQGRGGKCIWWSGKRATSGRSDGAPAGRHRSSGVQEQEKAANDDR